MHVHAQVFHWGVIRAVNEFARARDIALHVTWMKGYHNDISRPIKMIEGVHTCYFTPAWYMIKPCT
jgi:hypothetical protein